MPPDYPFTPPAFMLLTPNGRFETNVKVCLSISSHHPEHWQPSWSVRTALTALIAFMPTPGNGAIGSLVSLNDVFWPSGSKIAYLLFFQPLRLCLKVPQNRVENLSTRAIVKAQEHTLMCMPSLECQESTRESHAQETGTMQHMMYTE